MISLCCCLEPKITVEMETRACLVEKYGFKSFTENKWYKTDTYFNFMERSFTVTYKVGGESRSCSMSRSQHYEEEHKYVSRGQMVTNVLRDDSSGSNVCNGYVASWTRTEQWILTETESSVTTTYNIPPENSSMFNGSGVGGQGDRLADEYTTEMLIADAEEYLDTLPWQVFYDPRDSVKMFSGAHLPDDEYSCSIREIRVKFSADRPIPSGKKAVITYDLLTVNLEGETQSSEPCEVEIESGEKATEWIDLPVEREQFYKLGAFTYVIKNA